MGVIGFSFSKFDCKRTAGAKSEKAISINYGIGVTNVEKTKLSVSGANSEVLRVDFSFDVMYGNGLGKISIAGDIIYTDTPEIIKETMKSWESDKKLSALVNETVLKFVYHKCVVKALELSDSLNLPSPVPMPKISFDGKKKA